MSSANTEKADPPLVEVLGRTTALVSHCGTQPVDVLALSARAARCLAKKRVLSIGQLLQVTPGQLLQIRNMGRGSVREVILKLDAFLEYAYPGTRSVPLALDGPEFAQCPQPGQARPLTLGGEWTTFSGLDDCDAGLPLEALHSPAKILGALQARGVSFVRDLLDWTLENTRAVLGEEGTEQLLDALVTLASEQRWCCPDTLPPDAGDPVRRAEILAARWAYAPVQQLELTEETAAAIHCAGIWTLEQLLKALCPLHPALSSDLPVLHEVWQRLVDLELLRGKPPVGNGEKVVF